jgi:hypothetical protein
MANPGLATSIAPDGAMPTILVSGVETRERLVRWRQGCLDLQERLV